MVLLVPASFSYLDQADNICVKCCDGVDDLVTLTGELRRRVSSARRRDS